MTNDANEGDTKTTYLGAGVGQGDGGAVSGALNDGDVAFGTAGVADTMRGLRRAQLSSRFLWS